MNKTKRLLFVFIAFIIFACLCTISNANSIQSINIDIEIDDEGSAHVIENWECITEEGEGTEVYHPYYNLGNSTITDLYVYDETGSYYNNIGAWDTSASFDTKTNKCGINTISNGVELCWGISSYGKKTYTANYTITNFVSNLTDNQMIYWTLIPYEFSTTIQDANIIIKKANYQLADTTDVYGYGNYGGACYVYDGAIYMSSDGPLETKEYMTILAFLPKEFAPNATNDLDYDSNYYLDMANEGAEKYIRQDKMDKYIGIGSIVAFVVGFIALIKLSIYASDTTRVLRFGKEGRKLPSKSQIPYYRDIPFNGDIFKIYFVAIQYKIIKNTNNLIGAFILKWIKEEKISIIPSENDKKNKTKLDMRQDITFPNYYENELFSMLKKSSKDGILEDKEFEKYCKSSYEKVIKWFDKILKEERTNMSYDGLVRQEKNKYYATAELKQEAINIAGLKKYLEEYTLIDDREPLQVHLLEEYLIIAQILGIADKVAKDFKKLYPNMIEESHYQSYNSIIYIHDTSTRGTQSAKSAQAAYTSGGGGYSSGGGGGGSFGGGGGRRRFPLKCKLGIDKQTYVW